GADVDHRDGDGNRLLRIAWFHGSMGLVRFLIGLGVDLSDTSLDMRDNTGWTALFCAVSGGYTHMSRVLVENGASVYIYDEAGRTPLHYAVESRNLEIVRLL
ncbi:ankyrin repeat-containing domain protein, partial [Baffinella frigidus]